MSRLLLKALIYVITVNHTPVATFDSFRGMNRWVHDYRVNHPSDLSLTQARVNIYKCSSYDLTGEKCLVFKTYYL